jgi:hypothetical protein
MTMEEVGRLIDTDFHVLRVEVEVNRQLGGDATICALVRLMLEMGWTPPSALPSNRPKEASDDR